MKAKAKCKANVLKDKKVLITAGPTWVPIDDVRVISNTATGETGLLLAEEVRKWGASARVLLGPSLLEFRGGSVKHTEPFKFFSDLQEKLARELVRRKYDVVIHSAAVSDYQPRHAHRKKIPSGKKNLSLKLAATPKIIDSIKKQDPDLMLVGFKFEPQAGAKELRREAMELAERCGAEIVVANTIRNNLYEAYIVKDGKLSGPFCSKKNLAVHLVRCIAEGLSKNVA
ncbi:MAG: phosphopantothenoylcysteine decarboxylase [Candidatus Omnitrophota bacterium]|jgi:phosphopantothenoylcysteine decarboxylase/phosphopantothenate--cysteine ligase